MRYLFQDFVWDVESFPNLFTLSIVDTRTGQYWQFEIGDRVNHGDALRSYIHTLANMGNARMVGYNNIGYDYPVLHHLMQYQVMTAEIAFMKTDLIINRSNPANKFQHIIWDRDQIVPQVDLFKIHHFDNAATSVSLKVLEFNMRSRNVEDLPFPPGSFIEHHQVPIVLEYNLHDIQETWKFLDHSKSQLEFRDKLTQQYSRNFTNLSDAKIGEEYFLMELHKNGIETKRPDGTKIQTVRQSVTLKDAVLPWITFKHPEFNRVLEYFKSKIITQTKGVFENLSCTVNGFTFDFGTGGIHGSLKSTIVCADDYYDLVDVDVASYYPNLAIANNFYPEHLGEYFCKIYLDVYNQRKEYKKGTPENAMLKLALNATYGKSNSKYSSFYDWMYTMKITINGQLLLCMLAEELMGIEGLRMVQINTDGLTVLVPKRDRPIMELITDAWQSQTKLTLEHVDYSRMFIRDVNNYIAEYKKDGKLKRKGAYAHNRDDRNELPWHKNHGGLIVAKAAEAYLVRGESIRKFIETHTEMFDFFFNTKVPRSSKLLLIDDDGNETLGQNVTRYYVAKTGFSLVKLMPPLAKKPNEWRRIGINVGWKVWPCNDATSIGPLIDYEFYIAEAEKLCQLYLLQ